MLYICIGAKATRFLALVPKWPPQNSKYKCTTHLIDPQYYYVGMGMMGMKIKWWKWRCRGGNKKGISSPSILLRIVVFCFQFQS